MFSKYESFILISFKLFEIFRNEALFFSNNLFLWAQKILNKTQKTLNLGCTYSKQSIFSEYEGFILISLQVFEIQEGGTVFQTEFIFTRPENLKKNSKHIKFGLYA